MKWDLRVFVWLDLCMKFIPRRAGSFSKNFYIPFLITPTSTLFVGVDIVRTDILQRMYMLTVLIIVTLYFLCSPSKQALL